MQLLEEEKQPRKKIIIAQRDKCGRCFVFFLFYSGRKVARLCGFTKAEQGRLVMLLPTTVAVQTVSQQGVTLFRLAVISITVC